MVCAGLVLSVPAAAQEAPAAQDLTVLKKAKSKKAVKPAAPAIAAKDKKAKTAEPKDDAKGKPLLVGTYGDWAAYQSANKAAHVCYALSQPKDREPANLQRNPAFLFISRRPSNGVKNEISLDMGFPLKENAGGASADVGGAQFELVAKGTFVWVKNVAQEPELLDAMRKGSKLVIKAPSIKGHVTTDSYSLNGLQQAWERVQKDCP